MQRQTINHPCRQGSLVHLAVHYLLSGLRLFIKIAIKQCLNVDYTILLIQALVCLNKVTQQSDVELYTVIRPIQGSNVGITIFLKWLR